MYANKYMGKKMLQNRKKWKAIHEITMLKRTVDMIISMFFFFSSYVEMVIFIKNDSINENIKRATKKYKQQVFFSFSFHETSTYWDLFVAVVNWIINCWWKCSHIPLWCKNNIQIQLERHYLVLFPFYALPRVR